MIYFEWSASNDQKIIMPWRLVDGPEFADAVAAEITRAPVRVGSAPRFLARSVSQCHCSMKIPIAGCGV